MAQTMTAVDFMTGILAGLALKGERVIDVGDTRFDQALAKVYDGLLDRDEFDDLEIDFQIIPNAMHRDSTVVQDAITAAIESRLAARINPRFERIMVLVDDDWAQSLTADLPGGSQLYRDLVDQLLQEYKGS